MHQPRKKNLNKKEELPATPEEYQQRLLKNYTSDEGTAAARKQERCETDQRDTRRRSKV